MRALYLDRIIAKRLGNMRAVRIFLFAIGLSVQGIPVWAGQTGGQFIVTARLQAAGPSSAFCRSSNLPDSFGAVVTVVCSTGAVVDIAPGRTSAPLSPMHGGAYRYVTQVWRSGDAVDIVDASTGAGTTTSWRVVTLANRDYLEMTLAW